MSVSSPDSSRLLKRSGSAKDELSVKALYENLPVAETYIKQRFGHPWGQVLHQKQVAEINKVIEETKPEDILEIAPGPARLATELKGVRRGLMLDNSVPMLALAKRRLRDTGLAHLWQLEQGNAFELQKLQRRFNFLFTFRFIRHFRREERARLYHAINASLQAGGLLMFDVVNKTVREKVDASQPHKAAGELDVYDETYSPESFRCEMTEHGFKILHLTPVINHFFLQSWISYRFGQRLTKLGSVLVQLVENVPSRQPLEWIALCQKIG